jgi:large subunit ribosomal protein L10
MKSDKKTILSELVEELSSVDSFYIVNTEGLTANNFNAFRKECFTNEVICRVVKNTLIAKAIAKIAKHNAVLADNKAFKGVSALLVPGMDASGVPAKLLLKFRENGKDKPFLKCAVIDGDLFIGDENLSTLSSLKSKHELIGDILLLLKSPINKIMASLNSSTSKIAGILNALEN